MTKTRLALLSTLSDMHTQSVQYNLAALAAIVDQIAPDLLCVELPQYDWESGNLAQSPVEVQRSLLPLAELSEVVVVPVAPDARQFDDFAPQTGWRGDLAGRLALMDEMKTMPFGAVWDRLCRLAARPADHAWKCGSRFVFI